MNLVNTSGQLLFTNQIFHNQSSSFELIELNKKILNGIYILKIAEPGNINESFEVIISD